MKLIEPPADAATTKGTKQQYYSILRFWGLFYLTYGVYIQAFGKKHAGQTEAMNEKTARELRAGRFCELLFHVCQEDKSH